MKKGIVFFCSVVLLLGMRPAMAMNPGDVFPDDGLQVMCSPDLDRVMQECKDAYASLQGEPISLQVLDDRHIGEWTSQPNHLVLLTKVYMDRIDPQQAKVYVIGREVYVPIMNPENPYLELIRKKGISPKEFAALYTADQQLTWGALLENDNTAEVHAYRTSDPSFTAYLADFAAMDPVLVEGKSLQSCEEVIAAVTGDRFGIGFCTLSQLTQLRDEGNQDQLAMVPVDLNDNNGMDHFEEIYGSLDELTRGIWIGKYAGSLYSRIFAVGSGVQPGNQAHSFLTWLTGDGQEVLAANGYSILLEKEQEALLASLENAPVIPVQGESENRAGLAIAIIAVVAGLGVIVYLVFRSLNEGSPSSEAVLEAGGTNFAAESSEVPGGYYFDRSHTWAFQERDGNIRIGLDSFIEKLTGPITRVEMKDRGEQVRKGRTIFTVVQNGKRMDIKSPVSGRIHAQNEKLRLNAELINSNPFSEGWVYMIEPSNWSEENVSLFRAPKYREWIKSEVARLRDFLAQIGQSAGTSAVMLQEGGEISAGILKDLGPEAWDDFQTDFLRN